MKKPAQTTLRLFVKPRYVVDPADNDGRPVIMVLSSNFVEFTVVDRSSFDLNSGRGIDMHSRHYCCS